jgi:hypothetical protein
MPFYSQEQARERVTMDDTRWRELCALIMNEKDPDKLWALVDELNKTLDEREKELRASRKQAISASRLTSQETLEDLT